MAEAAKQGEFVGQGAGEQGVTVGVVMRYPVTQPAGDILHQLILVTGTDDDGALRGVPLCYEHEAARFPSGVLV